MRFAGSSRILRTLLLVLAGVLGGLQLFSGLDTWQFASKGASIARTPLGMAGDARTVATLEPEAAEAGVANGYRILAVEGEPPRGLADLPRLIRNRGLRPGDVLHLSIQAGDGSERSVGIRLRSVRQRPLAPREWTTLIFLEFGNRWLCLILGFYVALVRPRDPLAWILLGLTFSFSQLTNPAEPVVERWAEPAGNAAIFLRGFGESGWPFWMLMFGLYFPDPHSRTRLMAWARWIPGVPIGLYALARAVADSGMASNAAAFQGLYQAVRAAGMPVFWGGILAVGVFFANIPYKSARQRNPDEKRRLRLLAWGAHLSLTPIFVLLLTSLFQQRPMNSYPPAIFVPVMLLVFLFPVTLAYVIVVERAMDVRVVLRQGLQHALAQRGVRVAQVFLTAVILLSALQLLAAPELRRVEQLRVIGLSILALVLLERFSGRARSWIDRKFFCEQVNAEAVLSGLGEQLRGILDVASLTARVGRTISETMHVPEVSIALDGERPRAFEVQIPIETARLRIGTLFLGLKRSEEPYTRREVQLLGSVASQTALAIENSRLTATVAEEAAQRERLHRELEIARDVQERIMPQRKPAARGLDYHGLCRPAASVGGDCFEYVKDVRGRLFLAIGDVSGKGIPAALLMSSVNAALRGLIAGGVGDVAELVTQLNRLLYESTPKNRFVTFYLACFDPKSATLEYCSAGHDAAVLVRAGGEVEWLSTRNVGLALTPAAHYSKAETALEPGDCFLLYTDGATEAHNPEGAQFGQKRIANALRGESAEAIVLNILAAIDRFAEGAPQHDDITLLCARRML